MRSHLVISGKLKQNVAVNHLKLSLSYHGKFLKESGKYGIR